MNDDLTDTISLSTNGDNNISKSTRSKQKFVVNKNSTSTLSTSNKNLTINNSNANTSLINNESKQKYKIPFFKDFSVKFTKRENIDKKILRKFRKFLKDKTKKNMINWEMLGLNNVQKKFWICFIGDNLLPPMKYVNKESNENVDFKSFNTNYMVWLLSHKGSVELYDLYLNEQYMEVLNIFIIKFALKDTEELNQLQVDIKNLAHIFHTAIDNEENALNKNENYLQNYTENYEEDISCNSNTVNNTPSHTNTKISFNLPQENFNPMITMNAMNMNMNNNMNNNYNNNGDIFSLDMFNMINNKNPLANAKENLENSFDKSEDLGKMFNTSFDYENDYMFHE